MLIIVESPAKAKTISKIVGKGYVVKASVGHVRQLSDDKKTPDGRKLEIAGIDIENNFRPIYEIEPSKAEVVKELVQLAKRNKDGILFATDSDREGEAISWHLAQVLGVEDLSQIKRLEFHEITKSAIEKAIASPRQLNLALVSAQQARQVLDKLVGFKLSPVLWKTMGNFHLSAGRVQSPALHLICQREKEIEKFQAQEYWEVKGDFDSKPTAVADEQYIRSKADQNLEPEEEVKAEVVDDLLQKFTWTRSKGLKLPKVIGSQSEMEELLDALVIHTKFKVSDIIQSEEKIYPKPPFITSTLQQAASSQLGYSPRQTMQLAQKLYEGVDIDGQPQALITYMRTDSLNLSQESLESARQYILTNYPQALPSSPIVYKSKSRNAQEAHEAIRPVNPQLTPEALRGKLEPRLLKLYELIWKQMLTSQMLPEIRGKVKITLVNDRQDEFSGVVSWTKFPGFKFLSTDKILPKPDINIQSGQVIYLQKLYYQQHFTKPPARFSAASLVKKLEELGIGRPSTYASIISTLQDRQYVQESGRQLIPTPLGVKINDLLSDNFKNVVSSELTAHMEENLDAISRGEMTYDQVLSQFWYAFKKEVDLKQGNIIDNKDNYRRFDTNVKCPICEARMELKLGRFGEYYQCQVHKEHQFPKNFQEYNQALEVAREQFKDQVVGKKCAKCGKDLVVRVSKSHLRPYISCPEYKVGNDHTVLPINFGPCPKCAMEGRTGDQAGVLIQRKGFGGRNFIGCSLPKEICGYIEGVPDKPNTDNSIPAQTKSTTKKVK
jgi:DNA topoisomerase-1